MGIAKYIWMAVTPDEYELPLAIADTAKELAELVGISTETVKSNTCRHNSGNMSGRKFVKVPREWSEGGQ